MVNCASTYGVGWKAKMAAVSLRLWKHEVEWLVVLLSTYIVFVKITKYVAADSVDNNIQQKIQRHVQATVIEVGVWQVG